MYEEIYSNSIISKIFPVNIYKKYSHKDAMGSDVSSVATDNGDYMVVNTKGRTSQIRSQTKVISFFLLIRSLNINSAKIIFGKNWIRPNYIFRLN